MKKNKTERAIVNAFNVLIRKYPFDDITIGMIAEQADTGRTTVYRYFHDKYDIMNANFKWQLDAFFAEGKSDTIEDLLRNILEEGREHWQPLRRVFDSTGVNSIENFIADYSTMKAKAIFAKKFGRPITEAEDLQIRAFCIGAAGNYALWVRGEYDNLTPAEAAAVLYELIPEKYRGLLWKKER